MTLNMEYILELSYDFIVLLDKSDLQLQVDKSEITVG